MLYIKAKVYESPLTDLYFSDPGAIQTHDLQNRNLTLYSLSYGAKSDCKSIKNKSINQLFSSFCITTNSIKGNKY